jgi:phosphoenolpyruvate-protein phosphotransferase
MQKGIPVSPGVAMGRVYMCESATDLRRQVEHTTAHDPQTEWLRLRDAARRADRELAKLVEEVRSELGPAEAAIFESQRAILRDGAVEAEMREILDRGGISAEKALATVIEKYEHMLGSAHDEHLRARAVDIRDVGQRALSVLLNEDQEALIAREEYVVAVARQVIPSRLLGLLKQKISGVVTEFGSRTSHAAILCRSYGIPAVTGVKQILEKVSLGDLVAVDGTTGEVWVNPNKEVLAELRRRRQERSNVWQKLDAEKDLPSLTLDKVQIHVLANIRTYKDAHAAAVVGAEGVGLFRTEFLYMNARDLPTEEEQMMAYRSVIEEVAPKPVTIRTLDLGGDKMPRGLESQREPNPFLGLRSIRLSFQRPDIFKTQIRAVLRAASAGPTKLMFPLVTTVGEMRRALEIVEEARKELREEELPHDPKVPVGLMIEVPAAAIMIEEIMKIADFASIGTNDLIQYVMAADRTNPQVVELYDALDPAVLRTIKHVVEGCRKLGKHVEVCGEMAARPLGVLALLGLGVKDLSVGVSFVPIVKGIVRSISQEEMEKLAEKALAMDNGRTIENMYRAIIEKAAPWAEEVA